MSIKKLLDEQVKRQMKKKAEKEKAKRAIQKDMDAFKARTSPYLPKFKKYLKELMKLNPSINFWNKREWGIAVFYSRVVGDNYLMEIEMGKNLERGHARYCGPPVNISYTECKNGKWGKLEVGSSSKYCKRIDGTLEIIFSDAEKINQMEQEFLRIHNNGLNDKSEKERLEEGHVE